MDDTRSGQRPPRPPILRIAARPAANRSLCTDCGVSRTAQPKDCAQACQFIQPDYPGMETRVHGRARDPDRPDELFFGPFQAMYRARLDPPEKGAQWTGITTSLAAELLRRGAVDGVICMVSHPADRWKPVPALITDPDAMAEARGMRMGYAPLLAAMEPARKMGLRRLAVIGIPCQIYALRALEAESGFESITVIGTPCSDNTTTERFHEFLARLSDRPDEITYLEFRADYRVEVRFRDGRVQEIPFLNLPLSDLPSDFFPLTCRTCVDYTNALADITVGYMAGQGEQWVIVRNERGAKVLEALGDRVVLSPVGSAGDRTAAVKGFIENTRRAAGGLPLRRLPKWARPIVSWLQPRTGPRGLEFARARVEMKAAETVLHLRRQEPARMKWLIPDHVWAIAARYGLTAAPDERK